MVGCLEVLTYFQDTFHTCLNLASGYFVVNQTTKFRSSLSLCIHHEADLVFSLELYYG